MSWYGSRMGVTCSGGRDGRGAVWGRAWEEVDRMTEGRGSQREAGVRVGSM